MKRSLFMINPAQQNYNTSLSEEAHLLEVIQGRGDEIIDVQFFQKGEKVTIGSELGTKLLFAGRSVGWIPSGFSHFTWMMFPFLQAQKDWKSSFISQKDRTLARWDNRTANIRLSGDWEAFYVIDEDKTISVDVPKVGSMMLGLEIENHLVLQNQDEWYSFRYVLPKKTLAVAPSNDKKGLVMGGVLAASILFMSSFIPSSQADTIELLKEQEERVLMWTASVGKMEAPKPKERKGNVDKKSSDRSKKVTVSKPKSKTGKIQSPSVSAKSDSTMTATDFLDNMDFSGGTSADINTGEIFAKAGEGLSRGNQDSGHGTMPGGLNIPTDTISDLDIDIPTERERERTTKTPERQAKPVIAMQDLKHLPIFVDTPTAILQIIMTKYNAIRNCYRRELGKNPSLSGKITVKFSINTKGKVVLAGIKTSTMNHSAVEKCIVKQIKGLNFSSLKLESNISVSYPFLFSSSE